MNKNTFNQKRDELSQNAGKNTLKMAMGDTFRVRRFNEINWVLELWVKGGKAPQTGEMAPDHWAVYGYYGQLFDVAHHLINQSVTFADGTSGQQVLDAIRQAEKSIVKSLEEALK